MTKTLPTRRKTARSSLSRIARRLRLPFHSTKRKDRADAPKPR